MRSRRKTALLVVIAGALIVALVVQLRTREKPNETWEPKVEGFLAVATPCCYRASLWKSLETVTSDGQRARAATSEETAEWLNTWPYRGREDEATFEHPELSLASQGTEVRCVGPPSGDPVPRRGDDVESLEALRERRECTLAKWKVWSEKTAAERPNERHTVWIDEDGHFHGRVDYWR